MQPDLEHKGFLKKMEKQINNKQKLVPVFAKNPFKPAARLMYGSKRYTNVIKFNSCQKYDNLIDKHIDSQARNKNKLLQYEIKNPHQDAIKKILQKLEQRTFKNQDYETGLFTEIIQNRRFKNLILTEQQTIDQSTIDYSKCSFKLPRLNQSYDLVKCHNESSDSKISQLLNTCHEEKSTLSNIDSILINNHKKQRRHLGALKQYVNILSLDI
ncbi:unnamed protein product [Paramecium pentaurelia]|uniref:Uncharacterized protein n=1 Tax=Paramecium pentaurelia TaxID=43138 RepID=A0A8S1T264_9CILI|nr:unnamed protein product [Paramecium pentaurelia]